MEQFDIEILYFGGLNWCQQQVSLSIIRIQRLFSLSFLNWRPKNNKNKYLYENGIGTISRNRDYIIYMIV
jgi:hypothetical protein